MEKGENKKVKKGGKKYQSWILDLQEYNNLNHIRLKWNLTGALF